jgi:hypothetical protein
MESYSKFHEANKACFKLDLEYITMITILLFNVPPCFCEVINKTKLCLAILDGKEALHLSTTCINYQGNNGDIFWWCHSAGLVMVRDSGGDRGKHCTSHSSLSPSDTQRT